MTKVLIVGAAGFLGSNFSNWFMCHTNYEIVGIDNCSKFDSLLTLQPNLKSKRYNLQISNVLDKDIFNKILKFEDPDFIIFATETSISIDAIDSINVKFTNLKKIIVMLDYPWNNLPNLDLPLIGLCANNVFGSRQHPRSLIPSSIEASLFKTQLDIEISNSSVSWLYVKDVYSAIELLMEKGEIGSRYKIESNEYLTQEQVLEKVFKIIGFKPQCNVKWYLEESYDMGLKPLDNWKQEFTINNALEHTICWYDTNRWIFDLDGAK